MTKIRQTKQFDVSKSLASEPGKILADFIQYTADALDQVIRVLRNGVSFGDNIDANFKTATLKPDTVSALNTSDRKPACVLISKVVSTLYGVDSFQWFIDGQGITQVQVGFTNSPSAQTQIDVVFLIIYG